MTDYIVRVELSITADHDAEAAQFGIDDIREIYGQGILEVDVSTDGGKTWNTVTL